MNNNFNPYTVPEYFFENVCQQAVSKTRRAKRAVSYGIAGTLLFAALFIVPVCIQTAEKRAEEKAIVASSTLASVYEYDIFLQVNF